MKKILISLVALTGIVAGSYMMLSKNNGLDFTKYLPDSIAQFFSDDSVSPELNDQDVQEMQTETVMEGVVEEAIEEVQIESHDNSQAIEHLDDTLTIEKEIVEEPVITEEVISKVETNKDTSVSPEVDKLEDQLNNMNSSISKLDLENEQLQNRFKEMLKKNRELASKLENIEGEIAVNANN